MSPEHQAELHQMDAELRDHLIDDGIACVRRELAFRHRVYRRQVALGRMKPEAAVKEISSMTWVLRLLVEMRHGHATPAYVAALEAYGVMAHDGGHA